MAEQLSRLGQGAIIVSKDKYVGIGTINPEARLQIDSGSGIGTIDSGYSLSIRGDGIDGIQILSDSAYQGRIIFGDQNNKLSGRIDYDHSTDAFRLYTNGTEKVSILSGGYVGIGSINPGYTLDVSSSDEILARFTSTDNKASIRISDNDTHVFVSAENSVGSFGFNVGLHANNLNVNSSGYVGIGIANPLQPLHLSGIFLLENNKEIRQKDSGGAQRTIIELDSSDDLNIGGSYAGALKFIGGGSYSEVMRIHDDGNVGIGTVTPQAKLEVTATTHVSSVPTMQIYHRDYPATGDVNVPALNVNVGIANSELYRHGYVVLENHFTGGSYDSPNLFFKTNKNGSNHKEWWGVQAKANSRLSFSYSSDDTGTGAASASPNEVMSFSTNGNVGIGTTNPSNALHLNLSSASDEFQITRGGSNQFRATGDGVLFWGSSASFGKLTWDTNLAIVGGMANRALALHTNNGEKVRIDTSGNVGIGTSDPSNQLTLYKASGDYFPISLQANNIGTPGTYLGIQFGYTGGTYQKGAIIYESQDAYARGKMHFALDNGPNATNAEIADTIMTITSAGVGIGKTDPTARLDVKDNIIVRDTDSDLEHIQLWSNGTEGVLRLRNGANWGFIARGISNTPYIGAYSGGSLHVVGFTNATGSTYNSPTMSFDFNNDRVGIGSGVPSSKLNVHLTHQSAYSTSSSSTDHLQIRTQQNTGTSGAYSSLRMLASSNNGTNNAVGIINLVSPTNGNNDSAFTFQLRNSSGVYGEKVRIQADGNVGIGTTDPDGARLVIGEGPGANNLRLIGRAADGWAFTQFRDSSNTTNYAEIGARSTELRFYQAGTQYQTVTNGGDIKFNTYGLGNNTGTSAYYLTVDSSGNVIEELISSGTPTGSGTTNYIPKWTGAVALGNSELYEDANGNISIGTTSPDTWSIGSHFYLTAQSGTNKLAIFNLVADGTNGSYLQLGNASIRRASIHAINGSHLEFSVNNSNSGTSVQPAMRIKNNGYVGIGTTNPDTRLQVSEVNDTSVITLHRDGSNPSTSTVVGKIKFDQDFNSTQENWGYIQLATTSSNSVRTSLDFYVKSTSGNVLQGMTIYGTNDGPLVGIGTDTPTHKLDVRGDVVIKGGSTQHSALRFRRSDVSAYDFAYIGFETLSAVNDEFLISSAGNGNPIKIQAGVNDQISFYGYTTEYGRFDGSGNLGIGITNPSYKLHVSGGARIGDGETSLSPDSTSTSGISSRALTIINLEDTQWTTDALTAYNNTTGYDILNRASYSFFARPKATNILTHCTEINDNAHLYRFVNLNSAATEPLLRWQFYQYDGSGTTSADFKVASKLFEINHGGGTKLMIKGDGSVGIGTSDPTNPLDVLGKVSINTDGTLNWGNAKDYGRLTWDTGKAVVRGESGKALSLGANGTQDYIWIATDGKVGIGTTAPTSTLEVSGTDTVFTVNGTNGTLFSIEDDLSDSLMSINDAAGLPVFEAFADSHIVAGRYNQNDFYIASGGNVGIGTSNPTGQMEVYKSNSQGLGGHIVLNNNGLNTLNETAIIFGDGASIYRRGAISCVTESSPYSGSLRFKTGLSAYSSLATRMTIDGTGKVGIGTTNPDRKLHVLDGTADNSSTTIRIGGSTNHTSTIELAESVYSGVMSYGFSLTTDGGSAGGGTNNFLLRNHDNSSVGTVAFSVRRSDGNVGIGTQNAGYKLDVVTPTGGGIKLNHSDVWPSIVLATKVSETVADSLSGHSSIFTTTPSSNGNWPFNTTNGEYGALVLQSRLNSNGGIVLRTGYSSSYENTLVLRETGNVGIGITNPDGLLHLNASSQVSHILTTTLNAGTGPQIRFEHFRTNGITGFGDDLGTLDFVFQDSAGNEDVGARIFAALGGTSGDNTDGQERSRFKIQTLKGSSTLSESIEITRAGDILFSNGDVGIGVGDPNYKLDIAGSLHAKVGNSAFAFDEYNNGATIWLDGADGDFTGGDYFNISANNSTQLTFGFAGGTNMTLTSGGNLGIGITNPGSYKLNVNGDVNVGGEIVLSGDVEHKLRKLATSNITGVTTDVTELRGRQIDLYAFDDICLRAGTGDNIKMFAQSGSEKITVGANVIINNAGNNVDFWVEGDTDTALLYSDASTDRIGIGTSIPNEKFTVSGNISASGTVYGDASEFGAVMEAGLKTENISELPEGTVLVWSDGTLVPCSTDNDYKVMGISTTHSDSPIVLGAEPVLVTGSVNEGDYIITSDKQGHGRAISVDDYYAEPGKYFGRIIAQSLNNGEGDSYTIKAMIRKL